jgi:hypothetical protein
VLELKRMLLLERMANRRDGRPRSGKALSAGRGGSLYLIYCLEQVQRAPDNPSGEISVNQDVDAFPA